MERDSKGKRGGEGCSVRGLNTQQSYPQAMPWHGGAQPGLKHPRSGLPPLPAVCHSSTAPRLSQRYCSTEKTQALFQPSSYATRRNPVPNRGCRACAVLERGGLVTITSTCTQTHSGVYNETHHPWGWAPTPSGTVQGGKLCAAPRGEKLPVTSWVPSTTALSAAVSQRLTTGHLSALVASSPISFLSRHLTLLASP